MSIFLVIILILLFALIILSTLKLSIYFNTFMYLSKPVNYDKADYIANSSFFKFFYTNKLLDGSFSIETAITIILVVLGGFAMIGKMLYNEVNCGFISYYYGDPLEYLCVNLFIYLIIILALSYGMVTLSLMNNNMMEDESLEKSEEILKNFFVSNLDNKLLYDYYIYTKIDPKNAIRIAEKIPAEYKDNVFKLFFTYHILTDKRFVVIRDRIIEITDEAIIKSGGKTDKESLETNREANIARIAPAIKNNKGFYIIANYNHNNSVALPQFDVMINALKSDKYITSAAKTTINGIYARITGESLDAEMVALTSLYDDAQMIFMDTIKDYKMIYDKYYSYYMWSVLLSNFTVIYAILILVYIIIKILASKSELFDDTQYNLYYFRTDLKSYGIYIISLYYLLTTPIIIFGFN